MLPICQQTLSTVGSECVIIYHLQQFFYSLTGNIVLLFGQHS